MEPRELKLLGELEADRVKVKGDRATITVTVTNACLSGRYGKLYAVRENGERGHSRRDPG